MDHATAVHWLQFLIFPAIGVAYGAAMGSMFPGPLGKGFWHQYYVQFFCGGMGIILLIGTGIWLLSE